MLYIINTDARFPISIGLIDAVCRENGVNTANFSLDRARHGDDAIALLYLDEPLPYDVLAKVRTHTSIESAQRLQCEVNNT